MKNRLRSFLVVVAVLLCAVAAQAKTASEVFEAVSPSIVVVKTYDPKGKAMLLGSGVVLADGLIVTNCHVIKNAAAMKVEYRNKEYPATPRQTDWDRDVCTLTVDGLHAPPAVLGATNLLKVGQPVYAVGAPKGLELTLSDGIISSLRPVPGGQYLQITAPISPGSSGGGLFDNEGRLIGLPTFYLTEGQQLNFAVPVEWINELPKRQAVTIPPKSTQGTTAPQASQPTTTDWLNKAIELEAKKNWQGLKNHALRWTKTDPGNSLAWYCLGIYYGDTKEYAKEIEANQQAIRINPDFAEAWNNLGTAYDHTKQYAKAIEACQQAIRINPDYAMAWYNLGNAYGNTNQYAKEIEANQQAIRINPDFAEAWNNLGTDYFNTKQYAKAIEACQQAIRINPDFAEAWYNLGLADKLSGQTGKVMEVYKRLKTLDPDMADKFFNQIVMP
ncbi:MAG: tetratricopeptide repeat-containing serine protease family protein [Desulfobacteraceae bacterium]|nr:tetratricopeptide repeat-containing serine protease family protein [Desulfobacteraceae bacterium]